MAKRSAYVRSHRRPRKLARTPGWTKPPIRHGFWDKPENRLRYMRWLARQLGFRKHDEWPERYYDKDMGLEAAR